MMGKMQRRKGYRGENQLVNLLKALGFDAKRVPLSGGTSFAKGDILVFDKSGKKHIIEVKLRKNAFKAIYDVFYLNIGDADKTGFVLHGEDLGFVTVTDEIEHMFENNHMFYPYLTDKQVRKFKSLKKLLDGADILAIKDDRKGYLFLRYA